MPIVPPQQAVPVLIQYKEAPSSAIEDNFRYKSSVQGLIDGDESKAQRLSAKGSFSVTGAEGVNVKNDDTDCPDGCD